MTSVINAAHAKHRRVTLTLSVFAWTSGQAAVQKALLGSAGRPSEPGAAGCPAVRDRGADGINLDFEPLVAGSEDEFVALVRAMRAELDAVHPRAHLSFDTLGRPGNYPLERALAKGGADAVIVMGYDYRTAGAPAAGSIDPLAGPRYDLTETVRAYTARVPASRVILGVPYYGRAWSTVSDALNARTQTGARYGYSAAVEYATAVEHAAKHGRRYDSREVAAWTAYKKESCTPAFGCVTTWRQLYYDDAATLGARYDLVNRARLRGAGIWALGLRRRAAGALPRARGQARQGHHGARRRDRGLPGHATRHGLRRALDGRGRLERRRGLRRPGVDRRGSLGRLAGRDEGHERGLPRLRQHRLCVPGAGPRRQRQPCPRGT